MKGVRTFNYAYTVQKEVHIIHYMKSYMRAVWLIRCQSCNVCIDRQVTTESGEYICENVENLMHLLALAGCVNVLDRAFTETVEKHARSQHKQIRWSGASGFGAPVTTHLAAAEWP